MKKIILGPLLLMAVLLARGQEYVSFFDTAKQWNTMFTSYDYGGTPTIKTTLKFHISDNDTIINDTLYYLVINTGVTNEVFQNIAGFLREDISEKKVYFRETDNLFIKPKDRLLYDFSLKKGDTTEVFGLLSCESASNIYRVISTDKITLLNNEERTVWHLEQIGDQSRKSDVWIEGIGSLNGLLFPGCYQLATISFSLDLLCFFDEEQKLYISEEGTCEIDWSSDVEENEKVLVKVFPNPAKERVTIITPEKFQPCGRIQIFSINGQNVIDVIYNKNPLIIDLTNWIPGVYFLRIFDKSTQITSSFIVNK